MNITVNGQPRRVADGLTLADLVGGFGHTTKGMAAAVDGAVAPRSTWTEVVLHDGAVVEVLTAVQGG